MVSDIASLKRTFPRAQSNKPIAELSVLSQTLKGSGCLYCGVHFRSLLLAANSKISEAYCFCCCWSRYPCSFLSHFCNTSIRLFGLSTWIFDITLP